MTKNSIYSQRFIYVVVRRIETVSYTKSAVIYDTKHSKSAGIANLSVKYYIGQLFNR